MGTDVGISTAMVNETEQRDREQRESLKSRAPTDAIKARRLRKLEEAGRYAFLTFPGSKQAEEFVSDLAASWRIVGMSGAVEITLLLERV